MNKKSWIIAVTAAGVLSTTAVAGAGGFIEKVQGLLRSDIQVSVNGESTGLHPVYINGKAYLPARDTASALGYELSWNGKEIKLQGDGDQQQEEEADYILISGVIAKATPLEDGSVRLEVLGRGTNKWIILTADKETVIKDSQGKTVAVKDLKEGMQVTAEYGPIIALSYPGQSHAATITVGQQTLVKEETVLSSGNTTDGWQIQFGQEKPELTLNAGKETLVINSEGQPVEWSQVKPGTKVRAYYGPIMTKSLPPISPLHVLVVLDEQPENAAEFRELGWSFVPKEQQSHLVTKKDEALVSVAPAKAAGVMTTTEKQKQALADLVAKEGKLITVTYSTDQDALLGPLVVVIHPETKELIGFYARK
ncbi:hypothetical protein ACFFSY_21120 [Paenibacillus aurantiacus]|uniref:Copper amine oxidase N-terminal domain-containing protein n=1 Tax=Paenibacillus aurantiacus TaxID=1936118 RepID=A0ABV5KT81_9BACL